MNVTDELAKHIEYLVDTGSAKSCLIEALADPTSWRYTAPPPEPLDEAQATAAIDAMVEAKRLACDTTNGDWVVADNLMPETADKIRKKLNPEKYGLCPDCMWPTEECLCDGCEECFMPAKMCVCGSP